MSEEPTGLSGFWCFDCRAPMLRLDYSQACRDAEDAGWQVIRGVNRCPECAAADRAAQARTAEVAADINRRLLAMAGDHAGAFACVPMQGSGSFAVEAMLGSLVQFLPVAPGFDRFH